MQGSLMGAKTTEWMDPGLRKGKKGYKRHILEQLGTFLNICILHILEIVLIFLGVKMELWACEWQCF